MPNRETARPIIALCGPTAIRTEALKDRIIHEVSTPINPITEFLTVSSEDRIEQESGKILQGVGLEFFRRGVKAGSIVLAHSIATETGPRQFGLVRGTLDPSVNQVSLIHPGLIEQFRVLNAKRPTYVIGLVATRPLLERPAIQQLEDSSDQIPTFVGDEFIETGIIRERQHATQVDAVFSINPNEQDPSKAADMSDGVIAYARSIFQG